MTANDAAEFWIAYAKLSEVGKCDSPGATESLRVYQEWGEAGCPRPVNDFIYRRANVRSDGTEPPVIVGAKSEG